MDGAWYLAVLGFARATPWLHAPVLAFTGYGLWLFGLLLAGSVVAARRSGEPRRWALAVWAPVAVLLVLGLNLVLKAALEQPRPCRSVAGARPLLPCEPATDWSFPSTHTAVAMTAAVALLLSHRRLGVVAVGLAVLMGFSRVYVGAHYPHDVLAGLVLGALAGLTGLLVAPRLATVLSR